MKKLLILSLLIISNAAHSQTLEKKWNFLLKKSNTFKSHKVIKEDELHGMWVVIQDSIGLMKSKLRQEQLKVKEQNNEIVGLKNEIKEINGNLEKVTQEKINVIEKGEKVGQYINSLWIALAIVILVGIVLFILYKRSNAITEQKKKDYDLLSKSFEEYKTNKIEMERKLKREIQTYINKIEELKN